MINKNKTLNCGHVVAMLRGCFFHFQETGRSKGYGFVTYWEAEDAKKALEQMNGFELAGRPMKVGHVTEKPNEGFPFPGNGTLEFEELERFVDIILCFIVVLLI